MAVEYHPGTDIVIPNNVPKSAFRCALPNPKRYMKHNGITLDDVASAAFRGDYDDLEEMLSTGDETGLFNGDINQFAGSVTPLHQATIAGQTECVELLLKAKADPHIKEHVAYGRDPEDGRSALAMAREWGWGEIEEILEQAEKDYTYGWYVPAGVTNNAKMYGNWEPPLQQEPNGKPEKGWASSRPGVAEICGFDPAKYGTGPLPERDELDADLILGELPVPTAAAMVRRQAQEQGDSSVGLLFPGQGSQYVKMMSSVKDMPAVEEMLRKARGILGFDILEICLTGPEERLIPTEYCQPAVYLAGLAGLERLRLEHGAAATRFQAVAGLSLGEYTALTVAGVFSFEDGLKLVQARARAMAEASNSCKQACLSIAGVEGEPLQELCREALAQSGEADGVCSVTNHLFPKGFSCAGTEIAVYKLKELVEKAGALQAKVTLHSGAFHTSLMEPAKAAFARLLDETLPRMSAPKTTVFMNATAERILPGTDPRRIVELMKAQMTSPVLWEACVRGMIQMGIAEFYEVGPMKQLKAMMKRIDPKAWVYTTNVEV